MATDDPIRASDSDREVVVAALRDAYTTGRLTMEEFDERTSAAYQARTWGALRDLTVDLPTQPILGADVPGRRWSPAQHSDWAAPQHGWGAEQPGWGPLEPADGDLPQLPSHPPRNNLPPRPPVRRRHRPVAMLIPLAIWLLLLARAGGGTIGSVSIVVTIMLVVALLAAARRH